MNLTRKRALNVIAFAATFLFTAFGAHAEQAKFNLPIEVHWGSAVLEPGEYTISVPLAQSWPQQIVLMLNGKAVALLPLTESGGNDSSRSYLQLVSVRNTYFVSEYNSGSTGKRFTFRIPKGAAEERRVSAQINGQHSEGGFSSNQ